MATGPWGSVGNSFRIYILHNHFQSGGWTASKAPGFGEPRLSEEGR